MTTPTPPLPNPNPVAPPQSRTQAFVNRIPAGARNVQMPAGAPQQLRWLGDRGIVFYSWAAAMLIIGFDEVHNLHILPRPARLWDTSLVYGLLAIAGIVDPLAPIVNALALGYVVMLLWQLYNGNLTPAGPSDTAPTGGNNQPADTGNANTNPAAPNQTPSGKLGPGGTIPK